MTERVVELRQPDDGGYAGGTEFERTPPQDLHAEQSVLGGMLLSKDAIADVVEVIRSTDFYKPAHQTIYDIVLDLYGRGEPADAVTVAGELTRAGELGRIGGAPYLHTLLSSVPTAANAGYYAKIVAERAILRRLVAAGTRVVQLGYASEGGEVDDLVDRAQQAIYDVTERRSSEDYVVLGDVMQPAMDEMEAISSRAGTMTGVPTGFADLDTLTNGLHPGQLIVIAGRPGLGKALALDTPLVTPTGWTTMGEVAVGEQLLGADGRPTTVVAATDVLHDRACFEVELSDGTVIVADAEHQWVTHTRASRRSAQGVPAVRTTAELAATVRCVSADQRVNHSIAVAAPLQLPGAALPLPPYTLGAWLGDGHSAGARITSADPEVLMRIEAEGLVVTTQAGALLHGFGLPVSPAPVVRQCAVCGSDLTPRTSQIVTCGRSCGGRAKGKGLPTPRCGDCGAPSTGLLRCQVCHSQHGTAQAVLRTLGVLGDKHIPATYLRSSEVQRRALLAGLMDTAGTVAPSGNLQFAVTSARLAQDVHELVLSLGYRCTVTKRVRGRSESSSTCYTLSFSTADQIFGLTRKQLLHKERNKGGHLATLRYVVDVRPVSSVPVRCVEVDNADHLYLAGRTMVPTHNSTLGLDISRSCSIKHGLTSAIFSLEMSKTEITMRLLSAEGRIGLHNMRTGTMSDEDWTRLARRMGEVADAPLYIDDSPNLSMMEIRAKARRLKQRHDLKLVVIDYLQLMSGNKKAESRQQEVSELSRNLKLLAKELEVPVIAMSQLNRGPEQRTDKRPQLSDLRESGCLPAGTRVLRADDGREVTLGELHASGATDVPVWSLDDSLRYVRRHLTHVFSTGTKPVFRLTLASGKTVRATANHPFLTQTGWQALDALAPGDRVAVARHVPAPLAPAPVGAPRIAELARTWPAADVAAVSHKPEIRALLRLVWGRLGELAAGPSLLCQTREPLDALSRLLLRFGISAEIRHDTAGWRLAIVERDDEIRFLGEIGVEDRDDACELLLDRLVAEREAARGAGGSSLQGIGRALSGSTAVLERVTTELDRRELDLTATNDVLWDKVVAIEADGVEQVFDATVVGTHNFVAEGIAVHNSIEQDADMVILLHREDAYEKESPRAGEADFIVAKHRNGPTQTITVSFQGHYSRFVDMANG